MNVVDQRRYCMIERRAKLHHPFVNRIGAVHTVMIPATVIHKEGLTSQSELAANFDSLHHCFQSGSQIITWREQRINVAAELRVCRIELGLE